MGRTPPRPWAVRASTACPEPLTPGVAALPLSAPPRPLCAFASGEMEWLLIGATPRGHASALDLGVPRASPAWASNLGLWPGDSQKELLLDGQSAESLDVLPIFG